MRKDHLIDLIERQDNPVVIERAIKAMTIDPRLYAFQERIGRARDNAKGRAKMFFDAIWDAKIFDRAVLLELAGKAKTGTAMDVLFEIVDEQADGAYVDMTKKHGTWIKLGHLISQSVKEGNLPLKDEQGDPVPIIPRYTLFDDVAQRILSEISTSKKHIENGEGNVESAPSIPTVNKAVFDDAE